MNLKDLMELHKNGRDYLYYLTEGQYCAVAFIEGIREYIFSLFPDIDFKIYHSDNYTITLATKEVEDLYDILCYAIPELSPASEGLSQDDYWYAAFNIIDIVTDLGEKIMEFGGD